VPAQSFYSEANRTEACGFGCFAQKEKSKIFSIKAIGRGVCYAYAVKSGAYVMPTTQRVLGGKRLLMKRKLATEARCFNEDTGQADA